MPARIVTEMSGLSGDEPLFSRFAERKALLATLRMAAQEMPGTKPDKPVRAKKPSRPILSSDRGDLPESYGETRVVAMPVNPYLVHIYWELDSKSASRKTSQAAPGCLRFSDTTRGESPSSFDVKVDLAARSWYVHLWSPERRYSVELGVNRQGEFVPLGRSNVVETPRAWPMAEVEEHFARVEAPPPLVKPQAAPVLEAVRPLPAAATPAPIPPDPATPALGFTPPGAFWGESAFPHRKPEPPGGTTVAEPTQSVVSLPTGPIDAAEVLRRRLIELYALRWQERPAPTAGPGAGSLARPTSGSASELADLEALLPPRPQDPADLTGLAEHRFSPGFSSSLPERKGSRKPTS